MSGLRWVRLDGTFHDNPKIVALAEANKWRAITLYIFGLCYSGRHGTDGHIPATSLRVLNSTRTHAKQLVDAGLWHTNGDGWTIHDWHDYQPRTSTEISDARRRAANIRWHGTPNP